MIGLRGTVPDLRAPGAIRAVVFDLDGTLLDTEPLYRAAFMRAAASCGLAIPDAIYRALVGIATPDRGAILRLHYGQDFPWESLRTAYYEQRSAALRSGLALKPGAVDLLQYLRCRGIGCAVATSASRLTAERHLQTLGIRHHFAALATRDDVQRGKPHPAGFLAAAAALGLEPGVCLAVEDSPAGVQAASSAGMPTVLVVDTVDPDPLTRQRCIVVASGLADVAALLGVQA